MYEYDVYFGIVQTNWANLTNRAIRHAGIHFGAHKTTSQILQSALELKWIFICLYNLDDNGINIRPKR